ncbi:hypothetical protein GCM10009001_22320 [Virgibacillus siamensis]|uniref:Uncharacterized protein n=1 Tax=Virgibacillus siamensis TaxID=480071 RepID=A0ABN1G644_9BACI
MLIQIGLFAAFFAVVWLLSRAFGENKKYFFVGLGALALLFAFVTNINSLGERSFLTMLILCSTGIIVAYKTMSQKKAR